MEKTMVRPPQDPSKEVEPRRLSDAELAGVSGGLGLAMRVALMSALSG